MKKFRSERIKYFDYNFMIKLQFLKFWNYFTSNEKNTKEINNTIFLRTILSYVGVAKSDLK